MAGISGAGESDRPGFRLKLAFGPSLAVASAEEPAMEPSVDSDDCSVADMPSVLAEPVVMKTGVFGTVTPVLSTLPERAPNSARALDSERDA
jgi:hypothetical protein